MWADTWMAEGRGGNEVREEEEAEWSSAPGFPKGFVTDPFSTTSRALALKGGETRRRERNTHTHKKAKLRSKAPGRRVSMRSV